MQLALDLPKLDRTKTRQAVRAYFAVYRKYRLLLEMDVVPLPQKLDALPGYVNAIEPDAIRGGFFTSREPRGETTETPRERKMRIFVCDVEYKISKLPQYQSAIIKKLYMGNEPLPTDREVYNDLYDEKWYVSERHYYEQKAEAIMTLAAAFRIEQFAE